MGALDLSLSGLSALSSLSATAALSRDTFTDPDATALTSHVPDSGPSWSEGTGGTAGYAIAGNQLARADPIIRHAFMDIGTPNAKVVAEVTQLENLVGLLARRSDSSHYWELFYDFVNEGWQMSLVNGGPDTFKGPLLPGGVGTVTLEAAGNTITATGPGGDQHAEVDSTLAANTQVGIIVTGFALVASVVNNWLVEG